MALADPSHEAQVAGALGTLSRDLIRTPHMCVWQPTMTRVHPNLPLTLTYRQLLHGCLNIGARRRRMPYLSTGAAVGGTAEGTIKGRLPDSRKGAYELCTS